MNLKTLYSLLFLTTLIFSALTYPPAQTMAANLAAPSQAGPTGQAELGAFIDEIVISAMSTDNFPGAAISVVKDGQLFFQKGYGCADLETQAPVDPLATGFRIGSTTTKLFTWTAVMQLYEQGKLNLDEDINTYLDFEIPSTFPEPITLKHLLSHTPGFEERKDGHFRTRAEDMDSLDQYLKKHIPARVFPPGKLGAYSNYGASLAGYIVERVSGMLFAEYVEKNIFTPLGMTRSTLRQPLPVDLASGLSHGYSYAQGEYVKGGFEYVVDYPAGSMSSTAADMVKFMLAHLQDGRLGDARILSEQTARQMHSQLFTHDARIPGMTYGFFETNINGQRVISHGGDTRFFHSNLWLIQDQNTGIFVATNGAGGAIAATLLIYQYMDHYYPAEPEQVPPQSPVGLASRVRPYLGTYISARGNFTTFERLMGGLPPLVLSMDSEGNLTLSQSGGAIQLVEVEPGLLRVPDDADAQVVLHTDETGQAYLLTSDPWAYIRVPWYGTVGFRDLLMRIEVLLSMIALIGWSVAVLAGLRQRKTRPFLAHPACWVGALFGLVSIVLFLGLDSMLNAKDAVFGYPVILIERPPVFDFLLALPNVLAGLWPLMLVFTVLAWAKRRWSGRDRVLYTLLTLSGLSVIWGMWYWNLLF